MAEILKEFTDSWIKGASNGPSISESGLFTPALIRSESESSALVHDIPVTNIKPPVLRSESECSVLSTPPVKKPLEPKLTQVTLLSNYILF